MNELVKMENPMDFEGTNVEIIIENGKPLFEIYTTGMALGQVVISKGKTYPRKDRIDDNIKNAEIEAVFRNGKLYINEQQLYDLMLEMKTDKVKPFRKWITGDVLPRIYQTGGYVVEDREEEFINSHFPSFGEEVKLLMVQDLRKQNKKLKSENQVLNKENDLLAAKVLQWDGRPFINAAVRRYAGFICNGSFGEAWVAFKKELLYRHSINLNSRITLYLNSTGKKTKPKTLDMLDNSEIPDAVSTIVALCRDGNVDISDLIEKFNKGESVE